MFRSTFGETPSRMWADEIAGMTDAQIQRGLKTLRQSGAKYPPSLPEFFRVCTRVAEGQRYLGTPSEPDRQHFSKYHCRASQILFAMQRAYARFETDLPAALKAKRELVADAERNDWPMDEFAEMAKTVIKKAFLAPSAS
ncbi:MAG: hypothetical protein KDA32_10945 [Phycisphaerales bacterium]|nr:hypothetical protein [Phycisphaerales bacterium]